MSDGILGQSMQTPGSAGDEFDEAARRMEELQAMDEKEEKRRLNAQVPAQLYERFKRKCEQEELSLSEAVRRLLMVYTEDVE